MPRRPFTGATLTTVGPGSATTAGVGVVEVLAGVVEVLVGVVGVLVGVAGAAVKPSVADE
jgi:hypothetical protein